MVARLVLPLPDQEATRELGRRLARLIRRGDVIALRGVLGSGKTELARALLRARAGAEIEVPSPSYTLVQDYRFADMVIRHIDLYRIRGSRRSCSSWGSMRRPPARPGCSNGPSAPPALCPPTGSISSCARAMWRMPEAPI